MLFIIAFIVAIQLVAGQALWKIGVQRAGLQLTPQYLFSPKVLGLITSRYILLGTAIYVVATVLYLGLLAKYQYSLVQSLIVPLSLIAAFLLARIAFHERLTLINYLGLSLLIFGIWLATRR